MLYFHSQSEDSDGGLSEFVVGSGRSYGNSSGLSADSASVEVSVNAHVSDRGRPSGSSKIFCIPHANILNGNISS